MKDKIVSKNTHEMGSKARSFKKTATKKAIESDSNLMSSKLIVIL
jgi:hypothetical protein